MVENTSVDASDCQLNLENLTFAMLDVSVRSGTDTPAIFFSKYASYAFELLLLAYA